MARRVGVACVRVGACRTGNRHRRVLSALLASSVLGWTAVAAIPAARAQQAAPTTSRTVDFSIPAQPLPSAINAFIRATGWQISYSSALARGKTSSAVSGTMSPAEALRRLVAGTGVQVRIGAPGSAALVEAGGPALPTPASDGSLVLDPITIAGGSGNAADVPFETPGSSSHISAEQLERVPPTSLGDVFRSAPGVIASGNRVGASVDLNIRGLQGQNRVNVMVDGTRQTAHTYRGYRGSRNEVYVDPDFLGGIDISKGPSGGAGGVGAMGGVVNMRVIDAHDIVKDGQTYGFRVKGGLGSNTESPQSAGTTAIRDGGPEFFNGDSWYGSAVAATITDDYEFVAGVSRRKAGNYFTGKNGKSTFLDDRVAYATPVEKPLSPFAPGEEVFNTSQDMTSALAKGKVTWGDGHSLGLSYIYYGNTYGEMDETLLSFAMPGGFFIPAEQHELSKTTTHTLKTSYAYDPEENDLIDFTSNLWMSDIRSKSTVMRTAEPGREIEAHVTTYGGDLANISIAETPLGLLTTQNGGEFVFEQARENAGFVTYPWAPDDPDYLGRNPTGDRTLASLFNRSSLEFTDWLTVSAALRYDHYWSEGKGPATDRYPPLDEGRLLPSASVTLTPFDGIQVYGSYTEGWRPPSLRETAASQTQYLVPNPDLKPELSRNWEIGVNVLRDDVLLDGDKLRVKAGWFHNTYDEYIIRTRGDLYYTWANIDEARFTGFEASVQYDTGTFFLEGAFTKYTDVTMCDEPVLYRPERCTLNVGGSDYGLMNIPPEYSGSVTAGMRLFDQRLTLGGRAYFFSERYGGYKQIGGAVNVASVYHAATIFDAFGSYKFNDTATLDFSVENIGDRYYIDPLSTGVVPSPGRTIRMGFTTQF
jgi:hemoglobin/transferrin/lactoferrin receptor protein